MKIKISILSIIISVLCPFYSSHAENIEKNTAHMQAMDKITGRVSEIDVPVNGQIEFGSLSIVARNCKTRPVEETPENFAFIDITDTLPDGKVENIFKGWMLSSSPATHALEHPIYDVWLLKCQDTSIDESTLLTPDQLAQRDEIPMTIPSDLPKKEPEETSSVLENNLQNLMEEISIEQEKDNSPEMIIPAEFSFDEDEENILSAEQPENEIDHLDNEDETNIDSTITNMQEKEPVPEKL